MIAVASERVPRHVQLTCWAVAGVGLGYMALCIAGRLGSPWPLEWMEGASAQHAQRLLHGPRLYAAPRAQFIPFVYPPLSYAPMALGLWVSGGALWGARLASVAAIVVCVWALVRAGRHLGGSHATGWLAAGLFGAGYGYTGGFLDLARVDAWFLALCLWAVERSCARRHMQSLGLLALACLAKQHAGLLFMAAAVVAWRELHWRSLPCVMIPGLGLACVGCWLYGWTAGWIWTYCVQVPARHGIEPRLLLSFLLVDNLVYLPVLSGLVVYTLSRRPGRAALAVRWLLAAALIAGALGRAHPGGDDNVRLPAYALVSLVAADAWLQWQSRLPTVRARGALGAALLLQVVMLLQPPQLYWPTRRSDASFARLRAELMRCAEGPDYVAMDHAGFGARPFVHTLALSDLRMNRDPLGARATREVLAALRAPSRPAAFAISASFPALTRVLAEHYALCATLPALRMPSGYALAQTFVYRRASRASRSRPNCLQTPDRALCEDAP